MTECIYCGEPLVPFDGHPTWKLCPTHDGAMIARSPTAPGGEAVTFYEQVLGHPMDTRGRPSRPG